MTSNPILQAALRSRRGVEDLFLWITKSATAHCQHAERHRSAATLEADCAAAYIRRGDYKAARPLLRSQAARYFEDQWFELYVHVQTLIAYCDYRIRDWQHYMSTCFRILDPFLFQHAVDSFACQGAAQQGEGAELAGTEALKLFVTDMCRVAREKLRESHTREMHPAISAAASLVLPEPSRATQAPVCVGDIVHVRVLPTLAVLAPP